MNKSLFVLLICLSLGACFFVDNDNDNRTENIKITDAEERPDFESLFSEQRKLLELSVIERINTLFHKYGTAIDILEEGGNWMNFIDGGQREKEVVEVYLSSGMDSKELKKDLKRAELLYQISVEFEDDVALNYVYQIYHDLNIGLNSLDDTSWNVTEEYGYSDSFRELDDYIVEKEYTLEWDNF